MQHSMDWSYFVWNVNNATVTWPYLSKAGWRMWQNENRRTENQRTSESTDNDSVTFDKESYLKWILRIGLSFYFRYNGIQFSVRVEPHSFIAFIWSAHDVTLHISSQFTKVRQTLQRVCSRNTWNVTSWRASFQKYIDTILYVHELWPCKTRAHCIVLQ